MLDRLAPRRLGPTFVQTEPTETREANLGQTLGRGLDTWRIIGFLSDFSKVTVKAASVQEVSLCSPTSQRPLPPQAAEL